MTAAAPDARHCLSSCKFTPGCSFWTLDDGVCTLMRRETNKPPFMALERRSRAVSGSVAGDEPGTISGLRPNGPYLRRRASFLFFFTDCSVECSKHPHCHVWHRRGSTCTLYHAPTQFIVTKTFDGVTGFTHSFIVSGACQRVAMWSNDDELCWQVEQGELSRPERDCHDPIPRIYHAIGPPEQPYVVVVNSLANPEYRLQYHDDISGVQFVRDHCGQRAADAFECFAAPANRADLFRFCAMYSQGGVYMDTDLIGLKPFDEIISPCRNASVGRDFPQGKKGIQMKILAARPKQPIFLCMLNRILSNVERRHIPGHVLEVSGPSLLQSCYDEIHGDVALTYFDSRASAWPFTGMRTRDDILAYEIPNVRRHLKGDDDADYMNFFLTKSIYKHDCGVPVLKEDRELREEP